MYKDWKTQIIGNKESNCLIFDVCVHQYVATCTDNVISIFLAILDVVTPSSRKHTYIHTFIHTYNYSLKLSIELILTTYTCMSFTTCIYS